MLGGSSTKQSSATATGAAAGGFGEFAPTNNISLGFSFPKIDITEPMQIVGLGVIVFCGWLAWKRFK